MTCNYTHCAQSRGGIIVSSRSERGNFFSATDGRPARWMEADKTAGGKAQLAEVRSGIHWQRLQSAVTVATIAAAKPPSTAAAGPPSSRRPTNAEPESNSGIWTETECCLLYWAPVARCGARNER